MTKQTRAGHHNSARIMRWTWVLIICAAAAYVGWQVHNYTVHL